MCPVPTFKFVLGTCDIRNWGSFGLSSCTFEYFISSVKNKQFYPWFSSHVNCCDSGTTAAEVYNYLCTRWWEQGRQTSVILTGFCGFTCRSPVNCFLNLFSAAVQPRYSRSELKLATHPQPGSIGDLQCWWQGRAEGRTDRSLALTLWVARRGLAAKWFFQCRSPAVLSQILFWVCFCRARVCRVPECLLLTNHWIYSVSTLWSVFFISWHILLLCHASENELPKYEISLELCFIGMTTAKCWSDCFNPQCLCLPCTVKYAVLIVNENEIRQAFNRLPHVFRIFYS